MRLSVGRIGTACASCLISVPAGTDFGPLLKGLPNDRCPCPHWGYVLKGRLRVDT